MPNLRLTEKSLAEIAAPTEVPQLYYWDTETMGFGVIVGRRHKTFVARAWVDGKNRRVKIGHAGRARPDGQLWTVTLARAEARKMIGTMADGVDLNAPRQAKRTQRKNQPETDPGLTTAAATPAGPTLRDAYEAHVEAMRAKHCSEHSIATMKKEIERHLAPWLDLPISELRGPVLVQLYRKIKADAKPRVGTNSANNRGAPMANRVIAHVGACWNTLNRQLEGGLGSWNPAKSVVRDRLKPKRERIETLDLPDWYRRVMSMRNPIQRDGLITALFTGLRHEDVRTVRFENVDSREKTLSLPNPKGGEDRAFKIPLPKTCLEIIERRRVENAASPLFPSGDRGYVFPGLNQEGEVGPIADLRQQVHEGKTHVRFPAEDVHTLRRTYESVAQECGISEIDMHVLTNHSFASHNVNATYIKQSMAHLTNCQVRIEAALWARLKPRAKRVAKPSMRRARDAETM